MEKRVFSIIALITNLVIITLVVYSVVGFFDGSVGDGNMQVSGTTCFRYFTVDSNIFAAIACMIALPFNVRGIIRKENELPFFVDVFKYVSVVAVSVTFFTVIFFLGPTMGYEMMFAGTSLFLHGVCPILAMLTILLPEASRKIPFKITIAAALPVLIYGIVYLTMVVVVGDWPDFYGFNVNGTWYISFPIMIAAGYVIGVGLCLLRNVIFNRQKNGQKNIEQL